MLASLAGQSWGMFVVRGLLALTLGALAFVAPGPTLAALILVFAAYAIVDGLIAIGLGFAVPRGPSWWLVVGGVIAVAIGIYTAFNPEITATALVILIGAFAIVRGVAEVASAVVLRNVIDNSLLYVLSGVVGIAFGAYLVVSPGDGALAVLFVIGFYALFAGVMYLAIGMRLRSFAKTTQTEATGAQTAS